MKTQRQRYAHAPAGTWPTRQFRRVEQELFDQLIAAKMETGRWAALPVPPCQLVREWGVAVAADMGGKAPGLPDKAVVALREFGFKAAVKPDRAIRLDTRRRTGRAGQPLIL